MLKLSKLALSMSACLAITACGGSGGEGGNDTPNPPVTSKTTSQIYVTAKTGDEEIDKDLLVCLDVSGLGNCSCELSAGLAVDGANAGTITWSEDKLSKCQGLVSTSSTASSTQSASYNIIAVNADSNLYMSYPLEKVGSNKVGENTVYNTLQLNPYSVLQNVFGSADEVSRVLDMESSSVADVQDLDFASKVFTELGDAELITAKSFVSLGILNKEFLSNDTAVATKVNQSYYSVNKAIENGWSEEDILGWVRTAKDKPNPFDDVNKNGQDPKQDDDLNKAPVADFGVIYQNDYSVKFNNKSVDPDEDKLTYTWDFGDGKSSSEESPVHAFADSSRYEVILTTCNPSKACHSLKQVVNPKKCVGSNCDENKAPVADFSFVDNKGTVTFTNISTDPNGDALTFTWDFGDGKKLVTKSKEPFSHLYEKEGNYTVKLIASDGKLDSESATKVIKVSCVGTSCDVPVNNSPVALFTYEVNAGKVSIVNKSSDADNDVLTSTWNFGDGTGELKNNNATLSHTYSKAGSYTITLKVTDGKIASPVVYTQDIEIDCVGDECNQDNHAPVASFNVVVNDGVAKFTNTSTDEDGDSLKSTWNFGDGKTYNNNNPSLSWTYTASGDYTVTLTVSDGNGGTDSVSKVISVVLPCIDCDKNHEPVPSFTYVVDADGQVTFTNTSTDADNDALKTTWNFGDGTDALVNNNATVKHTFAPGKYTVSILVSDGQASKTFSEQIEVLDDSGLKCTLN